ncbi:MAG: AzlD domain-containing protein [Burkholderiales bacterium]|nr:AzlD domain-containing protein [Burkholderiales bacterium]
MSTWLAIAGVSAVVFLLRASFILFADPHGFPPLFRRALNYVPAAVLAAIVAPGLLMPAGAIDVSLDNPRWIAGVIAIAVAAILRHPLAAIALGMPVLWLLQWAMG